MTATIHDLPTPTLVVDLDVLEANLRSMQARCDRLGVALRPHVKTHKCVEIGRLQADAGARGITVATLEEARAFADAGFDDLTWAFPVIPGRIGEAIEIARRARLGLLVDSAAAIDALEAAGHPFDVWLEVDCGLHRSGVDPDADLAVALARRLHRSAFLGFAGILTHSGHAYRTRSHDGRAAIAAGERDVMAGLAVRLRAAGIDVPGVSVGSTPAMTAAEDLSGVTEARPGNYALFDATQVALGSCGVADCAATVVASVVSSSTAAGRSVVDAGALALSKDPGVGGEGTPSMGAIYADYGAKTLRGDARIVSLSQEHGVVDAALPFGERVRILPNHSCLAVACFDVLHAVRGEEVVHRWRVHRER